MQILSIGQPKQRTAVDTWYAAATVRLTPAARDKLDLQFEAGLDEMNSYEYAYLEAGGVPASFWRYESEPANSYTLQIDAPQVATKTWNSIASFVAHILNFYQIPPQDLEWFNSELEALFPTPQLITHVNSENTSDQYQAHIISDSKKKIENR